MESEETKAAEEEEALDLGWMAPEAPKKKKKSKAVAVEKAPEVVADTADEARVSLGLSFRHEPALLTERNTAWSSSAACRLFWAACVCFAKPRPASRRQRASWARVQRA